jgi:hypothetical protein
MKNQPAIHPFLFALFPVAFLYSHNIQELSFDVIIHPLGVILGGAVLYWFLLVWLFKDKRKAGLLTLLCLFFVFSYGHILAPITALSKTIGRHRYFLPVVAASFAWVSYRILRTRVDLRRTTAILNVTALVLIAVPAVNIGRHHIQRALAPDNQPLAVSEPSSTSVQTVGREASALPDIYYIIFDRYASLRTLRESYHYDNTPFVAHLESRGFFVASESRANYHRTYLSLAASLNMEYLDDWRAAADSDAPDVVFNRLQDYQVWRFLKMRGYKFLHVGSWWEPTRKNSYADVNLYYAPLLSEFSINLLRTTILYPFLIEKHWDIYRAWSLHALEALKEIPFVEGPKYVFAHVLLPHHPYVFDRDGKPVTLAEIQRRGDRENYLNQLIFTNKKIEHLVDVLLSRSSSPPIIILQSDEGPFFAEEFGGLNPSKTLNWHHLSVEALRAHMEIFNAYHLPGFDQRELYASVSPVNSFRLVFNHYFDADFRLLDDKHFIHESEFHRAFIDITDRLVQGR